MDNYVFNQTGNGNVQIANAESVTIRDWEALVNGTRRNRVLSLSEVLAMPDGARVWVEVSEEMPDEWSGEHTFAVDKADLQENKKLRKNKPHSVWNPEHHPENYNRKYRVWSLPVAPTEDEKAKYEWEVRDDA